MKNELAPPMMESRNPHNLRNFQEFASHRKKQSVVVWRRSVTDIYNSGFFCLKSWKKSIPQASLKEPLGNGFAVPVYADFVKFIFKVSII